MKESAKKLKSFLKNDDISDIIIFGSTAKGKITPNDIDIALISRNKNAETQSTASEIKKIFKNADISIITIDDLHKGIFFTLIKEGYSIKNNDYLHNLYKTKPMKIYKYSLKQLSASKKVMFERAIKSIKGINRLSNSVVIVPIENSNEFDDFLKQWEMDIDTASYEFVPMQRKEEIM